MTDYLLLILSIHYGEAATKYDYVILIVQIVMICVNNIPASHRVRKLTNQNQIFLYTTITTMINIFDQYAIMILYYLRYV